MDAAQLPEQNVTVEEALVMEKEDTEAVEEVTEEYETVRLEACSPRPSENKESWTTYPIAKEGGSQPVQSPVVSEITPDTGEESADDVIFKEPIRISVSNPKKAEEVSKLGIRSSYTSYCVQSETKLEQYPFTKRAVWRRFKDFEALYRLVHENHRGYVIPLLPSKNFFESKRGNETFIKERQMELNKFLSQVILHPELYKSEELILFLGCLEDLSSSHDWYRLQDKAKKSLGNSAELPDLDRPGEIVKKEIKSLFKKVENTFKKDILTGSHVISETERSLQDMVPQLRSTETVLSEVVEKSHGLGNNCQLIGEECGLLGRIWVTIARFEEEYLETLRNQDTSMRPNIAQIASVCQKSGYACVRVQQTCNKSTIQLRGRLNPLADELSNIPAIITALHDRTLALRSVYQAQSDLESARKGLDNLMIESSKKLGGVSGFTTKSAALTGEIKEMVEEVDRRSEQYDIVLSRNLVELNRTKQEKSQNLFDLVLNVAKTQQEYYEMTSLIWVNLADEIAKLMQKEAMP